MANYNLTLTPEHVAQSSLERLIASSNQARQWSLLLNEDAPELGLKKNATLLRVEKYDVSPYTGKCIFEIDRTVDKPMALSLPIPTKRVVGRKVLIKQLTAGEIVKKYGVDNRLYVGLSDNPTNTHDLIPRINELYKLGITEADVVKADIPAKASCIIFRFSNKSLAFTGSMLIDLFTKIIG